MSKKMNSQQSKHNILETARKLYYHNGFDETSFEEIAEACGITKPLIRYHFGSKAQLGNEIYGMYTMEQYHLFEQKAALLPRSYSFLERLVAYTLLTAQYYSSDTNAFRYYREFFSCAFQYVTSDIESISMLAQAPALADPDYVHMHYIGQQYAFRGLLYHYISGEIRCRPESFEKHIIMVLTAGAYFGPVDIDQLWHTGHEILSQIDISFQQEFIWR